MRAEVFKDNYGFWRWALIDGGEASFSGGPFVERDDAVGAAKSGIELQGYDGLCPLFVDGISGLDSKVLPPPRIDAIAEAAAAGLTPAERTEEQKAEAERVRSELIEKQKEAEKVLEGRKAEANEGPDPNVGMEEPKLDDHPIMKQRKRVKKTVEG